MTEKKHSNVQIADIDSEMWLSTIAEGGCFILAESAINDEVPSLAENINGFSLEYSRLYWDETGRIHASISPYLINVTEDNWPMLKEKVCHQAHWGVGIQLEWYMNAYTPAQQLTELLSHLREWTWLESQNGESRLLRLSDWKVLSTLMQASSNDEVSAIFGPIAQFVSLEGETLSAMTRLVKQKSEIPQRTPQQLSEQQWHALEHMEQGDQFAAYKDHLKTHHKETLSWPKERLHSFVEQQTKVANDQGFSNRQDTVKFLSLSLIFGQTFVSQEWAKKVLKAKQEGTKTKMEKLYQAALNELDKEVSV
ncbi:DUF4123 domain-containing protein [Shewanella woodyi]|uniref:DUF4123 domain-containing protein n=1 Tax=Shewanella woodyi (strain ATCC 51908 / MS32) TaxID=392500 RepID=B1KGR7_SHEWM|nr:DUF4123 domain-containing protein [Shewanella woodyi]ACA86786.1 conserved hypothetical protein [Shewanella woodyi ATCC 51908]